MAATPQLPAIFPGILDSSTISQINTALGFVMAPPICMVRQTVAQSLTSAATPPIAFDTTDVDTVNGHSNVTNNSRYTAVYAGWYMCDGAVAYAANVTGQRGATWSVNGTSINAAGAFANATSASTANIAATGQLLFLNVGDYVELKAFQNSGGALLTAVTPNNQPVMSIWRVSS